MESGISSGTHSGASRIAYIGVLMVAFAAPFELTRPLWTLGPFQLTNLELLLLSVLAVGSPVFLRKWTILSRALPWQLPLLVCWMLISALAAESHQADSLRFCARFLLAVALAYLTIGVVDSRGRLRGVLGVACLGGSIVGALGILEYSGAVGLQPFLSAFNEGPFYVGGLHRASSTLLYPTVTSMSLEISFGLSFGLSLGLLLTGRMLHAALTLVSLMIMFGGILATLTRGGMIALAFLIAGALVLYSLRFGFDRGFCLIAGVGCAMTVLFASFLFDAGYRKRLESVTPEEWYLARFEAPSSVSMATDEFLEIRVRVQNTGRVSWVPGGENPFRLSYHWLDPDEYAFVVYEGLRTPLPGPVAPGEEIEIIAAVRTPAEAGKYRLAWDMLQENRLWFSEVTQLQDFTDATIRGMPSSDRADRVLTPMVLAESTFQVPRSRLWAAAVQMIVDHPVLGVGPDTFRFRFGDYLGLEVWNRSLHANNMYLEILTGAGLIGGALFLWMGLRLVSVLATVWRSCSRIEFPLLLATGGAFATIVVHGLVDSFLEFTSTYSMIGLTIGLVAALGRLSGTASSSVGPKDLRAFASLRETLLKQNHESRV